MSYCVGYRTPGFPFDSGSDAVYRQGVAAGRVWERITWVSPRSWNALVDRLAVPGATIAGKRSGSIASAAAANTSMRVAGRAASVLHVLLAPGAASPTLDVFPGYSQPAAGITSSSYVLQATASNGRVLASVPMSATKVHEDFGPDRTVLQAQVPAREVAVLRVRTHGRVVAERARPPRAPRVRLFAPGRRSVARCRPRACVLHVRWRTSASPGASLQAAIDVSGDGGASWRTVYVGPDLGVFSVSDRLIGYGRRVRVRARQRWLRRGDRRLGAVPLGGVAARGCDPQPDTTRADRSGRLGVPERVRHR